ncbi:MAG: DMT family transporter [Bdellovibrionota bacterium]
MEEALFEHRQLLRNRRLGFLAFLCAATLYGTFGLFIRHLSHSFTTLEQVVLRSLGSALVAVPWLLLRGDRTTLSQLRGPKVWGFGLLFPIGVSLWTLSVTVGSVRSSVFGLYLGALLSAAVLSRLFFSERLTPLKLGALACAVCGAVVYCSPFVGLNLSVSLGAAAGIFQATMLCYRRILREIDRYVVAAVQSIGSLVMSTALLLIFSHQAVPALELHPLAIGLAYGAIVVAVSHLLLIGAKNLDLTTGNIILSTELVWSVFFAALFLGEIPNMNELLGCGILGIALVLSAYSTKEDSHG